MRQTGREGRARTQLTAISFPTLSFSPLSLPMQPSHSSAAGHDPRKQQQQPVNNPVPPPQQDLSVILVTAGCQFSPSLSPLPLLSLTSLTLALFLVSLLDDHTIKFWEAWSGICGRTIQNADSVRPFSTRFLFSALETHFLFSPCCSCPPQKQVTRLAISPDKKVLAVAGHTHVK